MPQIKVYHNSHFLEYGGRHSDNVPSVRPVARVQIPAGVLAEQALEIASQQTQHIARPWWDNDDMLLHVRSTSVGNMLADEQGICRRERRLSAVPTQSHSPLPPVSGSLPVAGNGL